MSASSSTVAVASVVTPSAICAIRFSGRFDRETGSELFAAIKTAMADTTHEIQIDLGDAYHIDNSALGMMFSLREKAKMAGKKISVVY